MLTVHRPIRRIVHAAAAVGLMVALAACGGTPAAVHLPAPQAGRLIRIYGATGWGPAKTATWKNSGLDTEPGHVDDAEPMGLTVASDGELLLFQPGSTSLSGIDTTGRTTVAPAKPYKFQPPFDYGAIVAAKAKSTQYIAVTNSDELMFFDRKTTDVEWTANGPDPSVGLKAVPILAASFLDFGSTTILQFGTYWLTITNLDTPQTTLTETAAPVPAILASAQAGTGALVATANTLVTLDAAGHPTSTVHWTRPPQLANYLVTAATSDTHGGILLTLISNSPAVSSDITGAVLHIDHTGGTTLLAFGYADKNPDGQCDAANTPAMQSHLGDPNSISIWNGRIVIADDGCGSVLELPMV